MTVSYSDVEAAVGRITGLIHRTPVLTCESLDEMTGAHLWFKCENFQKVGAFKARGAANAVFSMDAAVLEKGVATHSSGNHGMALARAASLRGVPAYIVVPEEAKQAKKDAIERYGGEIILCASTLEARQSTLADMVRRTGATFVPPYDDDLIIAGQGTAALELCDQVGGLDAIITPVGGGGLLAGAAVVAAEKGIAIYGAEPEGAGDAHLSFTTGNLVTSHKPDTLCDGLRTTVGKKNFAIIRKLVADILLVTDDETVAAMKLIWSRMKIIVEPSSAVTLAAVFRHADLFSGQRLGLVLTGGNLDLQHLPF